jgi:hypothetical protein
VLEIIRVVAAVELVLMITEALLPQSRRWLPLGGSHLAQIGLMFAVLLIGIDVAELFTRFGAFALPMA